VADACEYSSKNVVSITDGKFLRLFEPILPSQEQEAASYSKSLQIITNMLTRRPVYLSYFSIIFDYFVSVLKFITFLFCIFTS